MEIFDLNYIQGLVNEEYADYSIYKSESELFRNKIVGGYKISLVFDDFAKDELKHIARINRFFNLRLKPEIRVIPKIISLRETLNMHLKRELEALNIYKTIIKKSLNENVDLTPIIEVAKEEEKHYNTIKKYLSLIV